MTKFVSKLHIVFMCVCLAAMSSSMAKAQEVLGKQIQFRSLETTHVLKILKDGHILLTSSGNDCRSSTGEVGGEAFIGRTISVSFDCQRGGKQSHFTTTSTASFAGGVLRIEERWTEFVSGRRMGSTTQVTVLRIDGSSCTGHLTFGPVSDCVVQ